MTAFLWIAGISIGLLLLVWLGYPVYLWLFSLVHRAPNVPDYPSGAGRLVSVVLATRDNHDVIEARVRNLLDTDHRASLLEIVVSIDASGSATTAHRLEGIDPRVRVVNGDAPGGKAATLNAGVRCASGDVLVLADSRQCFDRRTIPELVAALQDPRFGAVSGALTLGGAGTPVHAYWALEKWIRHREAMIRSSIGVTGAIYAMRRELWVQIPGSTLLDDLFVPMSLVLRGYRIGFTYRASAVDSRTFDAKKESVRKTRTSTGLLQLWQLLPDAFSPRLNPLWLSFVWHKYLRLLTPFLIMGILLPLPVFVSSRLVEASRPVQLGTALVCAVLFMLRPARRAARWFFELNVSLIRALLNAARRRWHVWHS